MAVWLIWLIISGILIAAEIFTLSFYLLLASFGALSAALLAYFEYSPTHQILAAAIVTFIGWVLVHKFKPENKHPDSRTNPALNMDIGETVKISSAQPDGRLSVILRGARWDAKIEGDVPADTNTIYTIIRIEGSILILQPKA